MTRGLFSGDDERAYLAGATLCRDVSITTVERPAQTVVAYMDPSEYHTTWVGNKAIYRTRVAVADGWNTLPDGEEIYFVRRPAAGHSMAERTQSILGASAPSVRFRSA